MAVKWLYAREIADELGVHLRTVQRWVNSGKLPAAKIGGRWRIKAADYEAFVRTDSMIKRQEAPAGQRRFEVIGDDHEE